MSDRVDVRYKCVCLEQERVVSVRARGADEAIVRWVEDVCGAVIADDHREASPFCMRRVMEYAKFPADKTHGIGRTS